MCTHTFEHEHYWLWNVFLPHIHILLLNLCWLLLIISKSCYFSPLIALYPFSTIRLHLLRTMNLMENVLNLPHQHRYDAICMMIICMRGVVPQFSRKALDRRHCPLKISPVQCITPCHWTECPVRFV